MIRAFTRHRRMTQPLKNWPHIPFDGMPGWEVAALATAIVCISANYWWFA